LNHQAGVGQARQYFANSAALNAKNFRQLYFFEFRSWWKPMIQYRLLNLAQYVVFAAGS